MLVVDRSLVALSDGLESVQRRADSVALEEDPAFDEPGEDSEALVRRKAANRHGEDVVKLLEGPLHGLGNPKEDEDQCDNVEASVHAEGTEGTRALEKEGEGHGEKSGEAKASSDGETHADLTMREGEDLSGVGEGDGALTRGVEGTEQVDEEADETETKLSLVLVDESAQTSSKQSPEHLREGEEKQSAATEGVDSPEGGESEEPVDETETERTDESLEVVETGLLEDSGGVEGDDVDTAHLLGQHDGEGSEGGAANTGDGEELTDTAGVVGAADELVLNLELGADVVDVASNLDLMGTQTSERFPSLDVAALLHQPTRRLGAEVDETKERHGRDEGSTQHQTPVVDVVVDSEVDGGSEHDTKGRPHLPGHDEGTADSSRGVLGSVDRNSGSLDTHTNTHEKTASKLLLPGLAEGRTDDRPETEVGREEDDTTTTEPVVNGIREPAAEESRTDVGTSVDETDDEGVRRAIGTDAVGLGEEDVGTVGTGLIPTLDGGTNGTGRDGEEEASRHAPLVVALEVESANLLLGQSVFAVDEVSLSRVLSNKSTLLDQGEVLGELMLCAPLFDILHKTSARKTFEGVANPRSRTC